MAVSSLGRLFQNLDKPADVYYITLNNSSIASSFPHFWGIPVLMVCVLVIAASYAVHTIYPEHINLLLPV